MKKRRQDGSDETQLFERAMQNVKPLAKRPERPTAPQVTVPCQPRAVPAANPTGQPHHLVAEMRPSDPRHAANGINKKQAERLRRGKLEIDARLDLHGMLQEEAHRRLSAFIHRAFDRGHRCVLVITGKGAPKEDDFDGFMPNRNRGILKRNVPRWLNEPGLREKVLSVSEAQARHGGSGALYVLLRRRR